MYVSYLYLISLIGILEITYLHITHPYSELSEPQISIFSLYNPKNMVRTSPHVLICSGGPEVYVKRLILNALRRTTVSRKEKRNGLDCRDIKKTR